MTVDPWEADVLLRDGSIAQVRAVGADGSGRLEAFVDRISDGSATSRFSQPWETTTSGLTLTVGRFDDVIGVGRFVAADGDGAEVAYLVDGAHVGRGVGQLLLEHLAQAARERGLRQFSATVPQDHSRMLQIYREMGYRPTALAADGGQVVTLQLDPTDTAMGVMQAREQRAEAASMDRIFGARSVAVVGASRREDSIGQAVVRNLVLGGFVGCIYPVNPHAESVSGLPAYRTVQEIPDDIDLAVVVVPADSVADVVLDCAAKAVHGLIVISAGFAEGGDEGRARQRALLTLCRTYGLRLIGPNCLGVINSAPGVQMNASLATTMPPRGRVGFFCQSGALGTAILESVARRGLGLSTFVSAGNRADVSGNDLLQFWQDNDDTEVVLLYLESIGNPRKFSRIARRVSRHKPIVAVKSGRTTQSAPVGHAVSRTAAPRSAVDAMFAQSGVIQVDTLDEMFDVAQVLAHQPLPRGNRVAIVGNSDAMDLLVADAATDVGLDVTVSLSLGADAGADQFEEAMDRVLIDPSVDAMVVVYVPPLNVSGDAVANILAAIGEQSDKPIVSTFLGVQGIPELLRVPDVQGGPAGRGSVPSFPAPESTVRALAHVVAYADWRQRREGQYREFEDLRPADARELVSAVLAESPGGALLGTDQVHALLACYGIDLWTWIHVSSREQAVAAGEKLGWNVVLKAGSEHLRPRPDLEHVWRGISDVNAMCEAWEGLTSWSGMRKATSFYVQRMAPDGVPMAFRAVEDPLFGPLVSVGISGTPSELLGDRSFGIPPLTDADAERMVRSLGASPLLFGYRGAYMVDTSAITDIILRLAALKDDLPEVSEINLEPVLVGPDTSTALSARAQVVPAPKRRPEFHARRLGRPGADDTLSR